MTLNENGTAGIGTDCNSCFGPYSAEGSGSVFSVSAMGCTDMACAGETLEGEYLAVLSQVTAYSLASDTLRLTGTTASLVYRAFGVMPALQGRCVRPVPAMRNAVTASFDILGRTIAGSEAARRDHPRLRVRSREHGGRTLTTGE